MDKGLNGWLIRQDIFGHPVHVNYRGSNSYQTGLGAFCTFAMFVLTAVNAIVLFQAFLDNSKQEEKQSMVHIDPYFEGPHKLSDMHMNLATMTIVGLPPEIGYW